MSLNVLTKLKFFFLGLLTFLICHIEYLPAKEFPHHPILLKYHKFQGGEFSFKIPYAEPKVNTDFVGYFNFFNVLAHMTSYPKRVDPYIWTTSIKPPSLPGFNEEYFEWIDLLESVDAATDQFVMLEVGANYGRWSGRGAAAAKIKGIPCFLGIIEAIPSRWSLIEENMEFNQIDSDSYKVFPCAVGKNNSQVFFYITKPQNNQFLTNWKGQSICKDPTWTLQSTNQKLNGHQIYTTNNGYHVVKVKQRKLSSILAEIPFTSIDLCDFDVQGAEYDVIREAINVLNQRVKRLHIGTHGKDIEKKLKSLLISHGWHLERDYSHHQKNQTEYGEIKFVDGVQTYINKRF